MQTMMTKAFVSILALSTLTLAQDLRRHRKQRYVVPEVAVEKLEDDRDQLRQEVRHL